MARAERIAVVSPRFSETGTVGGAETLLKRLAELAAADGRKVTILTTCATDHFTWENAVPPGSRRAGQLDVHFFPVDADRDVGAFLRVQKTISQRGPLTIEDERTWIRNSVNSQALLGHLRDLGGNYDRILAGPYLFGLSFFASQVHPRKTILVPCLHDEPFAYIEIMKELFGAVGGFAFNTEPERDLSRRRRGVGAGAAKVRRGEHLPGRQVGRPAGVDLLRARELLADLVGVLREREQQQRAQHQLVCFSMSLPRRGIADSTFFFAVPRRRS